MLVGRTAYGHGLGRLTLVTLRARSLCSIRCKAVSTALVDAVGAALLLTSESSHEKEGQQQHHEGDRYPDKDRDEPTLILAPQQQRDTECDATAQRVEPDAGARASRLM